ncbi:MAG: NAD(P)H-binding protein [Alphaproteobacteria bacterium]|nr:NAD(P)H-binding protein [Alphaproteobacteria bacterium]
MKLIIGASGAVGIPLIKQLVQRGEALRALSSSEGSAERLRELGVQEVMVGDYRTDGVVEQAMADVESACYVPARFVADEFEIGKRIVDAAKGASLEHFLFCSAFHPQLHELSHHWQKLQVEEYLVDSDLLNTVVQPSMFMQNIRVEWSRIVEAGIYPRPYSPHSKMSVIDTDDLAEAMANIMTERKFQGASYQLAGPGPITHAEMAAVISEEIGKPVEAVHRDLNDWKSWAEGRGWTDYAITNYIAMCTHYDQHGFKYGNTITLAAILGREPIDYRAFVRKLVAQ